MLRFVCLLVVGCGRIDFDPRSDAVAPNAFAGPSGNALSLDGAGYADLDALCPLLTGPFTIEGWVRPAATQVDPNSVAPFALNSQDGNTNYVLVLWNWTTGELNYFDDVFTMRTNSMTSVPGDHWHFFALTFDAGHGILYSDGAITSDAQTPQRITSPCRVSLGQEWDGASTSDLMIGYIDEVSVWSTAKSHDEIVANMNANIAGSEPDLVGYYRFEDTSGTDSSGHARAVTLHGSASITPAP